MHADIRIFRCRQDNIGALLHDPASGATAVIDAPDETAIVAALNSNGWQLTDILVTHRHHDHVEAIPALKQRFNARVVAPHRAGDAVPLVDTAVSEGDTVRVGSIPLSVIETPGHCSDHVSYFAASHQALFCGDTLFKLGCGRMFEGDYETFWASLNKLTALPDDPLIAALLARAQSDAAANRLTSLTTLGEEKASNPFLRAGEAALARALNLADATPVAVFAELRERKNRF